MHLNRGLIGWGVFFIVLGAVPLAVQGGLVDADVVRRAWQLWPLILIGIGLGLVLERTRLAIVGGLLVAVTFGLMGGALIASGIEGPIGFVTCGNGDRGQPFADQDGSFTGEADVDLDLSCGELVVTTARRDGWTLGGRSPDGLGPEITSSGSSLRLRSQGEPGVTLGDEGSRWDVGLPIEPGLSSLSLSINAGSADARLDGLPVTSTSISVNAASAILDLGSTNGLGSVSASVNAGSLALTLPQPESTLDGSLSVNAGSLELCVPTGTPLRMQTGDSPLGSNNFGDRGLTRTGDAWTSPGYRGGPGSVDLSVSINLGSVTLNPEDGCD